MKVYRESAKSRVAVGSIIVVLICLAALILTTPALAQKKKANPDAFVQYEVYDVQGLIAELKADPGALTRFAKFFGTSEETVLTYFQRNLTVGSFQKATTLKVWGWSSKVGFYPRAKSFKAGEPVFTLADGTPFMRYGCANPFGKSLPPVASQPEVKESQIPKEEVVKPEEPKVEEVVRSEPPREPELTMPAKSETEMALAPYVPPVVEEEVAGLAQLAFIPAAAGGGGGGFLPFLGLIPIGIAAGGGGGGTIVPEPTLTPFAILMTASVVAFRLRRKR